MLTVAGVVPLIASAAPPEAVSAAVNATAAPHTPWWVWPLLLFITTFILGVLAVLAGIGGGVLFTPIVGGFFSV